MLQFEVKKMKKLLSVSVVAMTVLSAAPLGATVSPGQAKADTAAFTHGGILYTQADFDRAKQKISEGASPWIEAWNAAKGSKYASSTYIPHPVTAPQRWGGHPERNSGQGQLFDDSEAALVQATIWKVSSNPTEANNAKTKAEQIVDAWTSTVNTEVGGDEKQLLAGITGLRLAAAVDILQEDSNWVNAGKLAAAKTMLRNFFYPSLNEYLTNHYGKNGTTYPYYYRGNQDTTAMAAIMAIGILCDDTALYNEAVNDFKYGNFNGRVTNYFFPTSDPNLAQSEESGRDQAHPQLGIGMLADMAQMSYIQHTGNAAFEDLYEYSNRLILKGVEYSAKYNNGGTVPFTPLWTLSWRNEPIVSEYARGQVRPIDEMVWNHYHFIKDMADSDPTDPAYNTKARVDLTWPEPIQTDHPPLTTLLYTQAGAERPKAPANLTVTAAASDSQLILNWTAPTNKTVIAGYKIYRDGEQVGATSTPSYTDKGLSTGTTYTYTVKAYDGLGNNSADSNIASGTTAPFISFMNSNIGAVGLAGSYSYDNRTYTVSGSGSDIWGTADKFSFASIPITGDGTVIARVYSQENTNSWAKAGVMIRETLDAGSKHASVFITPANGVSFQSRSSSNGTMSSSTILGLKAPYWVKLVRSGSTFTGYVSPDGANWTQVSSAAIPYSASTVYAGLAVTSHDNTKLSAAIFDHVSIN